MILLFAAIRVVVMRMRMMLRVRMDMVYIKVHMLDVAVDRGSRRGIRGLGREHRRAQLRYRCGLIVVHTFIVAVFVVTLGGPFPGGLTEIAEPICHLANIPV